MSNMDSMLLRQQELVNNPTPRVPICLVLDTSGSMQGEPIRELNMGVQWFFSSILDDETARWAADISVVTFGSKAEKLLDFGDVASQKVPSLEANGTTPMGAAVSLALDLLEARKQEFSRAGVDYYQPWLVLMTDGAPTDDIRQAVERTVDLLERRKLTIFPIGVGPNASMETLAAFSPKRVPLKLKGLNFTAFFEWLSKSVSSTSKSTPGDVVPLDIKGIDSWRTL